MIIDQDEYLEHFGKKGMKWGVRRGGTKEQRRAGNRKFARNLAIGTGVGIAGGLAVGVMLKRNGLVGLRNVDTRMVSSGKDYILKSNDIGMHQLMSGVMNQINTRP